MKTETTETETTETPSATGQSTQDAMTSAVAWSRLGLTRTQVGEAVRVSLMAANVAEISSAEATEHLSSVTAVYGLRVSQLEGVLGMLNQTSNTARVRNQDLLEGLSSVAAVGKEAGFSLAELQGLLGGGVEISGQTGSGMGNALKNVLTRMGRSDLQDYLRQSVGVEIKQPEGGEQSRAEVLREIWITYQRLNEAERTNLAGRLAGAHQANRFAAIMDSYVRGQQLAIDSQLHLNSAQQENAKIVATMKSQVAGLRAEWDRSVAQSRLQDWLGGLARFGKNVLRLSGPALAQEGFDLSKTPRKELIKMASFPALPGARYMEANRELTRRWFVEREQKGQSTGFWSAFLAHGQGNETQPIDLREWAKLRAETPFERGAGKFGNELQEKFSGAEALQGRARLFETVAASLAGGTPENNARNAKLMVGAMGHRRPEFEQALAAGNLPQQRQLLSAAGKQAAEEAVTREQEALALTTARRKEGEKLAAGYRAQATTLAAELKRGGDARQAFPPGGGFNVGVQPTYVAERPNLEENLQRVNGLLERQIELNKELHDTADRVRQRYADSLEEVTANKEIVMEGRQENLNLMQRLDDGARSLGEFSQRNQAPTGVGRLHQRTAALREELDLLDEIERQTTKGLLSERQVTALDDRRKRLLAEMDSAGSDFTRAYVERNDRLRAGQRVGQRAGTPFEFGQDDTDRLRREQAGRQSALQRMVGDVNRGRAVTPELEGEAQAHENRLLEIKERLLDRRAELERDINQLLVERNQEFAKSLMDSGPAEMLRKLAAFRLSFDDRGQRKSPLDLGGFMALSPGLRGDYRELNPEFDPRLGELRREQRRDGVSPGRQPFAVASGTGQPAPTATATEGGPAPRGGQAVAAAYETLSITANTVDITAQMVSVNQTPSQPFNAQSGGVGAGAGRKQ